VHIDASEEKFDKNIKLTKQITKLAHKKKLWVQAELGAILGKEGMLKLKTGEINMEEMMTDPAEAAEFVAQTKVDTLAIAVGTIHGHFKGIEKVDQPRLQEIAKLVKVPLVLHGGSGLSAPVFKKAIKNGVSVINIDTNLRIAFKNALQKSVNAKMDKIDPRKILAPSTDAMQAEVEKMIKIFGSSNKA
jgi:fructose-bisphosphate aldolase class II